MRNGGVRFLTLGLLALVVLLLFAVLSTFLGSSTSLRGEITLQGADGEIEIPVTRVVVRLSDVSYADASSVTIAEAEYSDVTSLPLAYKLEWDEPLSDRNDYSVGARFYNAEGDLIYINDTSWTVKLGDRRVDFFVIRV